MVYIDPDVQILVHLIQNYCCLSIDKA